MEIKLNLYEDRFCRKFKKEVKTNDFDLSLAVCEDVLDIINIDMFEGGLDALTDHNSMSIYLPIVKNSLPIIKELLADLFEVSTEELRYVKLPELVAVIKDIITYSINGLPKEEKN